MSSPLGSRRGRGQITKKKEELADVPVWPGLPVYVDKETEGVILFGGRGDTLSNFARSQMALRCPFCKQSAFAQTVEHGFQAAKSSTCEQWHHVVSAPGPKEAKTRGRQVDLRPDWEDVDSANGMSVKAAVMLDLLRRKYKPDSAHGRHLEGTGDKVLIEDAPWDAIWGAGPKGTGTNALGRLLMKVREENRLDSRDVRIPPQTPYVRRNKT